MERHPRRQSQLKVGQAVQPYRPNTSLTLLTRAPSLTGFSKVATAPTILAASRSGPFKYPEITRIRRLGARDRSIFSRSNPSGSGMFKSSTNRSGDPCFIIDSASAPDVAEATA